MALKVAKTTVYYPVTSSFVFYPEHFGIRNKKGRPASGRFNNHLEIERLLPFLEEFDFFIYVDEIVSGGMMRGHLKQIFEWGVHQQVPVIAVGLADSYGRRSEHNRSAFEFFCQEGLLHTFLWEGCHTLITEDQKFLLGMHYVDYHLGPHAVPLLDESLSFYEEKVLFDQECFSENSGSGDAADPFCAAG